MLPRSEVVLLVVVEREEPDHETRLLIGYEKREKILLGFRGLQWTFWCNAGLTQHFKVGLDVRQNVCLGFDL